MRVFLEAIDITRRWVRNFAEFSRSLTKLIDKMK